LADFRRNCNAPLQDRDHPLVDAILFRHNIGARAAEAAASVAAASCGDRERGNTGGSDGKTQKAQGAGATQRLRRRVESGYNANEVREILRLIDWMMNLRQDLSQKFEQELTALEESLNMPYVTSMERIAEERGIVRGGASVLLVQLARLCGPLPEGLEQQVRELPIEALQELGEALFDFRSLPDLQAWLDAPQ
jgi:hypothetical protein